MTSLNPGDSDISAYCSTPSEQTPETTPNSTPDTFSSREVKMCENEIVQIPINSDQILFENEPEIPKQEKDEKHFQGQLREGGIS